MLSFCAIANIGRIKSSRTILIIIMLWMVIVCIDNDKRWNMDVFCLSIRSTSKQKKPHLLTMSVPYFRSVSFRVVSFFKLRNIKQKYKVKLTFWQVKIFRWCTIYIDIYIRILFFKELNCGQNGQVRVWFLDCLRFQSNEERNQISYFSLDDDRRSYASLRYFSTILIIAFMFFLSIDLMSCP